MTESLTEVLREAMGRVVAEGTGVGARLDWITTGGKTGTAQKSKDGKTLAHGAYVASFAGLAPLDKPRLALTTASFAADDRVHLIERGEGEARIRYREGGAESSLTLRGGAYHYRSPEVAVVLGGLGDGDASGPPASVTTLPTRLVVRGSTAPPR